jgi:uncharacterized protein (DUF1697 family)
MKTYIALFRGINVGGNNLIPMSELKTILEKLGLRDVRTYLQSGNAIFQAEEKDKLKLSAGISDAIETSSGFKPQVLLLEKKDLEEAIKLNPFAEAESNPKALAVTFLFSQPVNPDLKTLESLKTDIERFKLTGNVFYMYAPDGFGRSKLASRIEKCLGVSTTSRSWNTVRKIYDKLLRP